MENKINTLAHLYEELNDAIHTYGQCLVSDIEYAGLSEDLQRWIELTVDIAVKIEAVL